MNKTLSTDSDIFSHIESLAYIDSLQNEETVSAVSDCLDLELLKRVFWESFEKYFTTKSSLERQKARLKCTYINRYFGSGVTLNANINSFTAPHGFYGIFISLAARIGKGCTIFQGVTIGSNTLIDSKSGGAPTIGDNVYIGAGAKIIGNVKIGNNVRIGAGCTVTRDVPDNCSVIQAAPIVNKKNAPQDNRWLTIYDYIKFKSEEQKRVTPPPKRLKLYRLPIKFIA